MKFHFYSDPGHGWAKVKKSFLVKLGIADKITTYSYMRGEYAYLEEDCDVTTLGLNCREAGIPVIFLEHNARERRSKIRSYDYYKVSA